MLYLVMAVASGFAQDENKINENAVGDVDTPVPRLCEMVQFRIAFVKMYEYSHRIGISAGWS